MILFINTLITERLMSIHYDRGLLHEDSRFDIFKYMLASLSVIPWKGVYIYYELDQSYQHRYEEMDKYIQSLFDSPNIFHFNNEYQHQWIEAVSLLKQHHPDELTFFLANNDHIFIDNSVDYLLRLGEHQKRLLKKYPYVSMFFSHWAPFLGELYLQGEQDTLLEDNEDYALVAVRESGSAAVIPHSMLDHFWIRRNLGGQKIFRADTLLAPDLALMIPKRELVRHYDGYAHHGMDINACPPLTIPKGFFEKNIIIDYCQERSHPNSVLIDPRKENYSTIDPTGADWRCLIDEIPLFWNQYVQEIRSPSIMPPEAVLVKSRDAAIHNMLVDGAQGYGGCIKEAVSIAYRSPLPPESPISLRPPLVEVQRKRRNIQSCTKKHSLIILDLDQQGTETLSQLQSWKSAFPELEVIWLNLTTKTTKVALTREQAKWIDCVMTCRFNTIIHKNIALNEILSEIRGEILTIIEVNFVPTFLTPKIIEEAATCFRDPAIDCVEHSLYEVQIAEDASNHQTPTVLHTPSRSVVSLRHATIKSFGGFCTGTHLRGIRGGAYELIDRIKKERPQSTVQISEFGTAYYLSRPSATPGLPFSYIFQSDALKRG